MFYVLLLRKKEWAGGFHQSIYEVNRFTRPWERIQVQLRTTSLSVQRLCHSDLPISPKQYLHHLGNRTSESVLLVQATLLPTRGMYQADFSAWSMPLEWKFHQHLLALPTALGPQRDALLGQTLGVDLKVVLSLVPYPGIIYPFPTHPPPGPPLLPCLFMGCLCSE